MKHLLLAAHKPKNISSNHFLTRLKKHIGEPKAGYSGTLDPFASGLLVIGFGQYTRLLPFLQLTPKRYRATLWLGARSPTLDIQGIESVRQIPPFSLERVAEVLDSLTGEIAYTPPRFSARHIDGTRAYKLAREGVEFRSLGEMIAQRLGVEGALSALHRISEGSISLLSPAQPHAHIKLDSLSYPLFVLDSVKALPFPTLELSKHKSLISNGARFALQSVKSGVYKTYFEDFFSIIEVLANKEVRYLYNRIPYADTL